MDEPSSPLNRRGSRSEGRINIAVQDRLAIEVAERIKKEQALKIEAEARARVGIIDGISGIKIIKNDNKEMKMFLGQAGGGARKDVRPKSVDKNRLLASRAQGDFRILTESSTVSIPSLKNRNNSSSSQVSKPYKTMPHSPSPSNCLREIFEECDAGSSDNSNTNTPRPNVRSQANKVRTKFHKSRDRSGSSSDEDSAEKKRATKIVDSAIVKQIPRRDSHDDSSDSQDPGTNAGNSNAAGNSLVFSNGSNSNKPSSQAGERNSHDNKGKTTSNSVDIVGFRKYRTCRRQTETRLRESQSLNRITEVQECEQLNTASNFEKFIVESSKASGGEVETLNHLNTKQSLETIVNVTNELKELKNHNNSKAKGSYRIINCFNSILKKSQQESSHTGARMEVSSAKTQSNQMPIAGSDRSKKIKILGRYFQVEIGCLT